MRCEAWKPAVAAVVLVCGAMGVSGCGHGPKAIEPRGDERVTTMEADYREIRMWARTLAQRMLQSGVLNDYSEGSEPVRMVVSDIENKTNMSNFPEEMVLGRLRSTLTNSGKVRYVSTYGEGATDDMSKRTQDLPQDSDFENPEWVEERKFKVARLSLRTQFLYRAARSGRERQNTYEVRMFVTDTATGEVVWEDFSDPIGKKATRGIFGP